MDVIAVQYPALDLPARNADVAALVDADLALMREDAAARRAHWAEQVGLPGISRGDHVEWDQDGISRRGTFERVAVFVRGRRFDHYRIVVRETGGELAYQAPGGVRRAAQPALPVCSAFAGTGRRCTACRVHKNIHN